MPSGSECRCLDWGDIAVFWAAGVPARNKRHLHSEESYQYACSVAHLDPYLPSLKRVAQAVSKFCPFSKKTKHEHKDVKGSVTQVVNY